MRKFNFISILFFVLVSLLTFTTYAQNVSGNRITGIVRDVEGVPIVGAVVVLKGTTMGVITDADGKFSIDASPGNILQIRYLGYQTLEQEVGNKLTLEITLYEDIKMIEEVVVVGYGAMKKKSITGAVAQVKTGEINMVNVVSVDKLLQGRAAGLVISQFTAQPGGAVSMNIRGGGTPLYVIDGVPLFSPGTVEAGRIAPQGMETAGNNSARSPLSTLNPSDIETVDILKDAAATAIYGSAAANGVVLITTKKGKAGKVTVTYDGSVSTQKIAKIYDMLSGPDFRKYTDLAIYEDWLSVNNYYPYGDTPVPSTGAPARTFTDQDIATAPTFNHFGEISRQGIVTDHNISISGGSENSTYFASFNYYDQQSVLKAANFRRFTGRINLETRFYNWLKLNLSTLYSSTRTNNAQIRVSTDDRSSRVFGNEASLTGAAMMFAPDRPLEQPDGSLTPNFVNTQLPNPLAYMAVRDLTKADRLFFAPNLEVSFTGYLKGNVVLGVDKTSADRDVWSPNRAKQPTQKEENYGGFSKSYVDNYSLEGYLTFNKTLGDIHQLSAVAGAGYYRQNHKSYSLAAYNLSIEAVENYNLGLATEKELDVMNSFKSEFTKISQFARINYTLLGRYILGFTARRDGSDAFPPNKKYGFFPGVSVGWTISEESFMAGANWLNDLKLRMGYGTTGNDAAVKGNYYYLDQFANDYGQDFYFGGKLYSGVSHSIGKNENFIWQTDESLNAGLDFTIFKGRLSGNFDLYQRQTKDLLGYTYPPVTGTVARRVTNVGIQRYRGFELSLSGDIIQKRDFVWSAYANLSHTKRTWIERDPSVALRDWVDPKGEVNAYYGWKTNGIFKSREEVKAYVNSRGEMYQPTSHPGTLKYLDQNGDGVLDEKDVVYLGCWDPKFNFGFGTSLRYKSFDLTIGTYGIIGMLTGDSWMYTSLREMRQQNQSVHLKEAWASYNPAGTRYGIKLDTSIAIPAGDDYTLQDTWYWRLGNIALGYTLPGNLIKKININRARIFVDTQNIAVLTNFVGLDPEMERNVASPFPIPFTITTGINITF